MITHGLLQNQLAADGPPTLPRDVPALRVNLRSLDIVEASSSLGQLIGSDPAAWLGRRCDALWPSAERAAIVRRLRDAVLVGRDRFGYVALVPVGLAPVWVELEVRHDPRDGQCVLVMLHPQTAPRSPQVPLAGPGPDSAPVGRLAAMTPPRPPTDRAGANLADSAAGLAPPMAPAAAAPPALASSPSAAPAEPGPVGGPAVAADGEEAVFRAMTALAAAGVAVLAIEPDGTVSSATPEAERLLGRPIARLRGCPMEELLSLPDQAGPALAAARAGRARQSVAASLAVDGRDLALEWVPGTRPGTGLAVLLSGQPDSPDSERLRFQSRLVSFVAHDVRNSLAAVYCGLRALSEAIDPGTPERPIVDKALHEAQRASRIVDDVLAVSRPGRLARVDLDLCAVLRETLNRFRARAVARGTEIHERLEASAQVMADLSQLERVFDNLVENGLQAMPHYGNLTVVTRLEDRAVPGVRVAIVDSGVGIRPDMRPNIFEPFVTDKPGGTGLGLAITRRVILDHEGQIDFETEVGRGTTFNVWLPRLT